MDNENKFLKQIDSLENYQEQSEAWHKICGLLADIQPGWSKNGRTGLDAAINTIKNMNKSKNLLDAARNRLNDMLHGDDGQAWKEAQRFVDGLDAAIEECEKRADPVAMKYYDEHGNDKFAKIFGAIHPVPAVAQEPLTQVVKGAMLTPDGSVCLCGFGDDEVKKRLSKGYKYIYTEAPAVAVNEQMLEALEKILKVNADTPVKTYQEMERIAKAAIAAAEAAKKGELA